MQRLYNPKFTKVRRQSLRKNMPVAEQKLWQAIRNKQLGVKFRRQHGIGRYIVDFYCPELTLVVEIDGDSHFNREAMAFDDKRDSFLQEQGIKVIRFTNIDVMENIHSVLEKLLSIIQANSTPSISEVSTQKFRVKEDVHGEI
jgi:very-short-patch-repair endonuclease